MVYQRLMEHAATSRALPMSLPNVLTYVRIAAVPALVACLFFLKGDVARWSAFSLFVFAGITDWLDGYLARRRKQVTTFGQMIDPIADKLLTSAAFISLIQMGLAPAWMVAVVIGRELAVTTLRSIAYARGTVIPASHSSTRQPISASTSTNRTSPWSDLRFSPATVTRPPMMAAAAQK